MRRVIVLLALVALVSGCQTHIGKATADGNHWGLYAGVGDVTGPGGMEGAEISEGGALLGINLGQALIQAVSDYMSGGGTVTNNYHLPEGSTIPAAD